MPTRSCLAVLAIILFVSACVQHSQTINNVVPDIKPGWKKIPDSWITKALHSSYGLKDTALITQLANIIQPDTSLKRDSANEREEIAFNIVAADLDGDGAMS